MKIRQYVRDYGFEHSFSSKKIGTYWTLNDLIVELVFKESATMENLISNKINVIYDYDTQELEYLEGNENDLIKLYNEIITREKIKARLKIDKKS